MSSVISLTRFRSEIDTVSFQQLRQVVKIAFSQRRKKIRNTLKHLIPEPVLQELGVSDLRPEQLTVDQFIKLAELAADHQPT
jgi:16S rRNA (adenine1518-N6/adenine1519-N6)-dimethyltransferase